MGRGGGGDEKKVEREEGRGEGEVEGEDGPPSNNNHQTNQLTHQQATLERERKMLQKCWWTPSSSVMLTIDRIIYWAL